MYRFPLTKTLFMSLSAALIVGACGENKSSPRIIRTGNSARASGPAAEPLNQYPHYEDDTRGKANRLLDSVYSISQTERMRISGGLGYGPCIQLATKELAPQVLAKVEKGCESSGRLAADLFGSTPANAEDRRITRDFLKDLTSNPDLRPAFENPAEMGKYLRGIGALAVLARETNSDTPISPSELNQISQDLVAATQVSFKNLARYRRPLPTWLKRISASSEDLSDRRENPSAWLTGQENLKSFVPQDRLDQLAQGMERWNEVELQRRLQGLGSTSALAGEALEAYSSNAAQLLSRLPSDAAAFTAALPRIHRELVERQEQLRASSELGLAVLSVSSPARAQNLRVWLDRMISLHREVSDFLAGRRSTRNLIGSVAHFASQVIQAERSNDPDWIGLRRESLHATLRREFQALEQVMQSRFDGIQNQLAGILETIEQSRNANAEQFRTIEQQLNRTIRSVGATQGLLISGFQSSLLGSAEAEFSQCFGTDSTVFRSSRTDTGLFERCRNSARQLGLELARNPLLSGASIPPEFNEVDQVPRAYLYGWLESQFRGTSSVSNPELWQRGAEAALGLQLQGLIPTPNYWRDFQEAGRRLDTVARELGSPSYQENLLLVTEQNILQIKNSFDSAIRQFETTELAGQSSSWLFRNLDPEKENAEELISFAEQLGLVTTTREYADSLVNPDGSPFVPQLGIRASVAFSFERVRWVRVRGGDPNQPVHRGTEWRHITAPLRVMLDSTTDFARGTMTLEYLNGQKSADFGSFMAADRAGQRVGAAVNDDAKASRGRLVELIQPVLRSKQEAFMRILETQRARAAEPLAQLTIRARQWDLLQHLAFSNASESQAGPQVMADWIRVLGTSPDMSAWAQSARVTQAVRESIPQRRPRLQYGYMRTLALLDLL